jgi:hypothetical protein
LVVVVLVVVVAGGRDVRVAREVGGAGSVVVRPAADAPGRAAGDPDTAVEHAARQANDSTATASFMPDYSVDSGHSLPIPAVHSGPLPGAAGSGRVTEQIVYRCPALSVPAGFTGEGLPVGLQVIVPPRADVGALRVGLAVEQATGHGRRRPSLVERRGCSR